MSICSSKFCEVGGADFLSIKGATIVETKLGASSPGLAPPF